MSGAAPLSNHRLGTFDTVEGARGAMRDILGSLRNAEQLLRSVRVGPKALSSVVPLLHASCGPLLESWRQLGQALGTAFAGCTRSLDAFVVPRIEELELALRDALTRPLNAKQRLGLEKVVVRAAADLDAARALMGLVEDAVGGAPAVVDLWELTRETFQVCDAQSDPAGEVLAATLERGESVELALNARVAMTLIAIGVKMAAGDHPTTPHVAIRRIGRECAVVISRARGRGDALRLRAPRWIPPTLECACAAAGATRGRFEVDDDRSRVSLIWSASGE